MAAAENPIVVNVRDLRGAAWDETWTLEKLVYFILMCDVAKPKFETAAQVEWVPYDRNKCRWDKSCLTEEQFLEIAGKFPQSTPRPFVKADCDSVTLSFGYLQHVRAVHLTRKTAKSATEALVDICCHDARYVEFDYSWGRHIYETTLDELKVAGLASDARARKDIERVHRGFARELDSGRMIGRPIVLFCRDNEFEVPITLWFES